MAEKTATNPPKTDGEKLDTVLSLVTGFNDRLDKVSSRQDAMETSLKAKADAEEKEKDDKMKADKAKADEMAMADKAKADAEEKEKDDKMKADKAKADAEEKEKEEKEAKVKADAAATENTDLHKRIKALEAKLPAELGEEDRVLFVRAQSAAEPIYQAFGDSAGAPARLAGEMLVQYRRRLLIKALPHSPRWKDVDISAFNDKALTEVEKQVYADAMAAAVNPARVPAGRLQLITKKDETGRVHREYIGDPSAWMSAFQQPIRLVTGYNTRPGSPTIQ